MQFLLQKVEISCPHCGGDNPVNIDEAGFSTGIQHCEWENCHQPFAFKIEVEVKVQYQVAPVEWNPVVVQRGTYPVTSHDI